MKNAKTQALSNTTTEPQISAFLLLIVESIFKCVPILVGKIISVHCCLAFQCFSKKEVRSVKAFDTVELEGGEMPGYFGRPNTTPKSFL